jgi:hypothetical protein
MAWQLIGRESIPRGGGSVLIGPLTAPPSNGFVLALRQLQPVPFGWGHGVITFLSDNGRELGGVQVWPRPTRQSYYLGRYLTSSYDTGVLLFAPGEAMQTRIAAGYPLELEVLANLPNDLPEDRHGPARFALDDGEPLALTGDVEIARLSF